MQFLISLDASMHIIGCQHAYHLLLHCNMIFPATNCLHSIMSATVPILQLFVFILLNSKSMHWLVGLCLIDFKGSMFASYTLWYGGFSYVILLAYDIWVISYGFIRISVVPLPMPCRLILLKPQMFLSLWIFWNN